jgi:hypothetical protein
MALDILLIPAILADPERLFLGAKITISDRRNCLGICNSRSLEGNRREYNISEKQWYNSGRRSRRCIVMLV